MPVPAPPSTVTIRTVSRHCLVSPVGGDGGHLWKGTTGMDIFKLGVRPAVAPPLIPQASLSVHILPTCSGGAVTTVDQTICCGSHEAGKAHTWSQRICPPPANGAADDHFQKQATPGRVGAWALERRGVPAWPLKVLFLCEWPAETRVHSAGGDSPAAQTPLCASSKGSAPSSAPPAPLPQAFCFLLLLLPESPCPAIARPSCPPPGRYT